MEGSKEAIERMIAAQFAYEQARLAAFYGDAQPVQEVQQCVVSKLRLQHIAKALGKSIGSRRTCIGMILYVEHNGCTFWCKEEGE